MQIPEVNAVTKIVQEVIYEHSVLDELCSVRYESPGQLWLFPLAKQCVAALIHTC